MTSSTGERMIDADGHVCERLDLPPDVVSAFFTQLMGGAELSTTDPAPEEASHAEVMNRPGAYEPGPRLVDMDADGIDIAVLYPTAPGLQWVPDPGPMHTMAQTYNAWLHEYCAGDAARLFGVGLVALQDPALAVKEMERCVQDLRFRAVMIRPAPYIGSKKLNDPVYDPFWDAAAQLGCPIGVHPFSFADMPWNVVFLEGSGGWCAPMLERFDHHIEVFGSRYQKTPPSEVFKRQCYISFDPDEEALSFTANSKYVGADRIVWASDYPHPDAKIPGIVRELEEATEALSAEQRRL